MNDRISDRKEDKYYQCEPNDENIIETQFPELIRNIMDDYFRGTSIKGRNSQYEYLGKSIGLSSTYIKKLINLSFDITNFDYFISICFVLRLGKNEAIKLALKYSEKKDYIKGFPTEFDLMQNEEKVGRTSELVELLEIYSKKNIYKKEDGKKILLDVSSELSQCFPPLNIPITKSNEYNIGEEFINAELKRFVRTREKDYDFSNSLFYKNIPNYVLEAIIVYKDAEKNRLYIISYVDLFSMPHMIKHKWYKYDEEGNLVDDYVIHGAQEISVKNDDSNELDKYWPKVSSKRIFGKDYNLEENINLYNKYYCFSDKYLKKELKMKLRTIDDTLYFKERLGAKKIGDATHFIYEIYNYAFPEKNEYFFMRKYDNKYEFTVSNESIFMSELVQDTEYSMLVPSKKTKRITTFDSLESLELFLTRKGGLYSLSIKEIVYEIKNKIESMEIQLLKGNVSIYGNE